ncbi:MAG TPA: amidase family protein [Myxococcota bacterium]|nr:amidase family protein [Myxococcota bacterium]
MIRRRERTSREVVEAHLARIAEVDPVCRAIGAVLADPALAAADAADAAQRRGDAIGPLHGVPMTVKENIDVAGSATTQGVVVMKDAVPQLDAPHVAQLRAAGAIVIARTIHCTPCGSPFATAGDGSEALNTAGRTPSSPARGLVQILATTTLRAAPPSR